MSEAWQVFWLAWLVAALVAVVWWWTGRRERDDDDRQVDGARDAGRHDQGSPRDPARGFTPSHRPNLLVQAGAQDDSADLESQPGVGGTLNDVTNLGDPYTETEARVNRIFDRLNSRIVGVIMGAADDAVRGVTDQLNKAKGEIDAEVAKLQEQGVSDEALAGLKAVSQSLDDRNPDAPSGGGEESPGDVGGGDTPPADGASGNPDGVTDSSE